MGAVNNITGALTTAHGFSITTVHLTVTAKIPGIDQAAFQSIAAKAKAR